MHVCVCMCVRKQACVHSVCVMGARVCTLRNVCDVSSSSQAVHQLPQHGGAGPDQ